VKGGTNPHAAAVLPVPDSDGLVVGGTDDPWMLRETSVVRREIERATSCMTWHVTCDAARAHLVMELHGANIVQVPDQREGAAPKLVVPNFDLVVVASAHKKVPAQKMSRVEKRGKMSWS
jgi:hypothetical protein